MKKISFVKKNFLEIIVTLIILILGSIVIQTQVVNPYIDATFNEYQLTSFYDQAQYDFIVHKPTPSQVEELEARSDVDQVVPFYQFITQINGQSTFTRLIAFEPNTDLELTFFNQSLLLLDQSKGTEPYAMIDENLLATIGGNLATKLSFVVAGQTLNFPIGQVYERNPLYSIAGSGYDDGVFAITYSAPFSTLLESIVNYITYEGAFVKTNNYASFLDYLTTEDIANRYKPYGLVEPEENYLTEDSFLAAIYDVENFDYRQNNFYKAVEQEIWSEASIEQGLLAESKPIIFILFSLLFSVLFVGSFIGIFTLKDYRTQVIYHNASILKLGFLSFIFLLVSTVFFTGITYLFSLIRVSQYRFFSSNIILELNSFFPSAIVFITLSIILFSVYFYLISRRSKLVNNDSNDHNEEDEKDSHLK